jgi:hypothetical protein
VCEPHDPKIMKERSRTRRTRSAETVYQDVLRRIVLGTYRPGTRLPPERELAPSLGTSRPRIRKGSLGPARDAVQRAHEVRTDPMLFLRRDLDVVRELLKAADFLPALWLLNTIRGVYVELGHQLGSIAVLPSPSRYVWFWTRILDQLESGHGRHAVESFERALERHDRAICRALGLPTRA